MSPIACSPAPLKVLESLVLNKIDKLNEVTHTNLRIKLNAALQMLSHA